MVNDDGSFFDGDNTRPNSQSLGDEMNLNAESIFICIGAAILVLYAITLLELL